MTSICTSVVKRKRNFVFTIKGSRMIFLHSILLRVIFRYFQESSMNVIHILPLFFPISSFPIRIQVKLKDKKKNLTFNQRASRCKPYTTICQRGKKMHFLFPFFFFTVTILKRHKIFFFLL